jgi:prepilin-type N-terminal cleavage/methylation domain-containing protein
MKSSRSGFTLVELVIVILMGSILTSFAVSSFSNMQGRFSTTGARNVFQSMVSRAKAQAIEYGTFVSLTAEANGDSVWISVGDSILEKIYFADEQAVDLTFSSGSLLTICMSPRGWADTNCSTHSSSVNVIFKAGADSSYVTVRPLGQVVLP